MPVSQISSPAVQDERAGGTFDLNRVIRCRLTPAQGGPSLGATVLDLSARGADLLLRWWLGPGSAVSLRFSRGIFLAPFTVAARVTSCAEAGDGRWLLGCELARPLTADELAALLG